MAEIEHFVDPLNKDHAKYFMVKDMKIPLWSAASQEANGPTEKNITIE